MTLSKTILFIALISNLVAFSFIPPENVEQIHGILKRDDQGKPVSTYNESDSSVTLYLQVHDMESEVYFQGKLPQGLADCKQAIFAYGQYQGEVFRASNIVSACEVKPEMANGLRQEGKIYIVVGVVLIVILGFFVYLFYADKKVNELEEEINGEH